MLRRVEVDGHSVAQTTDAFGCSRPTFYQAQTAFKAHGLPGLVPRKRGPHGRAQARRRRDGLCARPPHRRPDAQSVGAARRTFGGALASPSTGAPSSAPCGARKKNGAERPGDHDGAASIAVVITSYETLRRVALGHSGPHDGPSLGFTLAAPSRHDGLAARVGDCVRAPPLRPSRRHALVSRFRPSSTTRWPRSGRTWCCCHQEVTWI